MKLLSVSLEQKKAIQKGELILLRELDRICVKYDINYFMGYGALIGAIRHKGFIPWDDDIDICMLRADYIRFKEACIKEWNSDNMASNKFFYQSNDTDPEYFYLFDKIRLNGTIFKESFVSKYNINHSIYLDIFPIDYVPENNIKRLSQQIRFHFFRTGLMAKYPMLGARSGIKKYIFAILRVLYIFIPLPYLYENAHKVAMQYDNQVHLKASDFFTPYNDTFDSNIFQEVERHVFEDMEVWIPKYYDVFLRQIYGDYMQLPPEEKRITRHTITELDVSKICFLEMENH